MEDGTVDTAFKELWPQQRLLESVSSSVERKETLMTTTTTTSSSSSLLSVAPPSVQPKLNMKPLESVPKLLPNFKAQPAPATSDVAVPPPVSVVEEEKPFVLAPLRPDSVDPYKPKAPKGWASASGYYFKTCPLLSL